MHVCVCVQTCIYVYMWMHACTHSFTPSLSFRDQVVDHSFMWVRDDFKAQGGGYLGTLAIPDCTTDFVWGAASLCLGTSNRIRFQ